MRSKKFTPLLMAASFFVFLNAEILAANVDEFSNLQPGDKMTVLYKTSGCFHKQTHELTFSQDTELTVSIVESKPTHKVDLGTLTLSKSDIAGLNNLMTFYRSKPSALCTTSDFITLVQHR